MARHFKLGDLEVRSIYHAEGFPAHRFRTLLATLGTLVKNRVVPHRGDQGAPFNRITQPTSFQQRAFELLGLRLRTL